MITCVGYACPFEEELDTKFDIQLQEIGNNKIQLIRALREVTGASLMEAKQITDIAPIILFESIDKKHAEKVKDLLETAGATVLMIAAHYIE